MIINKFNIGVDNIRVFFKGLLSVLLFVGIAGLSELVLAEEGPLIIEDPWPPYTYGDIGEPNGGIAVEITKTIFRRIGLEPKLALFPWKRVLKMAKQGDADGIMLLMKTEERETYLVYTDKLFTNKDRIFANNDTRKLAPTSLEALKGYRIGYVMAYAYGGSADEFLNSPGLKKRGVYTPKDNVELIINKRVDFIIEIKPVVDSLLKNNSSWVGNIHEMNIDLEPYDYHMAISKKSKYIRWLKKINQTIAEMKKDGTMNRLITGGESD